MSGKILIIAISVCLLFSFHDGCAIKASDMTKYCMTKTCVDYSNLLKANMNTSIDPCVDFYQYSCGKFLSTNSIPDDKTQITNLDALEKNMKKNLADLLSSNVQPTDDNWSKNAKNYYASCINLDRVNNYTEAYTLKLLNDEFGGWPLISGKSNPISPLDILKRIIKTGLYDLVSISVTPNPKDPTRNIIKITQPNGVPYEYLLSDDYIKAYKTYLRTIVGYLNPNRTLFDKDIDDIFELDRIISQIRMTISDEKNSTINIEMTVGDLQQKIPNFPWIDFITNGMFLNISDIKVNQSELVSIDNWDYLVKMQTIYSNYSSNYSQILQNYLLSKFFMDKVNDNLPLKYVQAKLDFNKLTTGQNALPDRSLFCISKGENYLPSEIGKVYVNKYFSQKAKNDALEMTNNILNEFKVMLQENTWMDATSKAKAIEKANYIKTDIGYPDYYDNITFVKTKFNYELDPNNLVKNILTSLEYAQRNVILGSLRSNEFRSFWIISATVLDANYNPSKNQIYVPAGNLNPPFYDTTLPNYLNYGAIGAVIGHEITHGFDDEGRRYDKNGRYYSDNEQGLWAQQTVDSFKNNTICIIDEYNGYNVTEINRNVNGAQTLGENIADNGGIKSAYRAYQKWAQKNIFKPDLPLYGINLTPNQLFFVSMAQYWCTKSKPENLLNLVLSDPHSPPEFRVKGMTQNSRYFQKAFECTMPSQMCSIW